MHKLAIMLVGLFSFAQAGIKVEKVLETRSIQEYNRWVKTNKAKYPKINPIYIRVTRSQTAIPILKEYRIEYYEESGNKIREETIVDSMTTVSVSPSCDRVLISKENHSMYPTKAHFTVKDERGKILFTLLFTECYDCWLTPIDIGIYIQGQSAEAVATPQTTVKVFNEKGEEINQLHGFLFVNMLTLMVPDNGRYAVFEGHTGTSTRPIIAVNRQGVELWRREIQSSFGISTFISKDGLMVGVNHEGAVSVYRDNGSFVRSYNPFGKTGAPPVSALSNDGSRLLTGAGLEIKYYDNETGRLLWETKLPEEGEDLNIRYIHITNEGERLIVICSSHNVYIFDRTGNLLTTFNLNLGKELVGKPIRVDGRILGEKKVDRLVHNWYSEVIGNYLVITKGETLKARQGIKETEKIIYNIPEE